MNQDYLPPHDRLALYQQALSPHTGNRYPPWFLKLLLSFYIDCCIRWLFFHATLGLGLVPCPLLVLSYGGIVCRLHQGTVAHTRCRVSGKALGPVVLSTPEQVPRSLCEVTLPLFAFIISAVVREGFIVLEPVSSV